MGHYLARRLLLLIPVALGITVVTFFLLRLIPGDPAVIMLDNRATAENVARLRHQLGLDRPLIVQYLLFLRNVVTGRLGESVIYRTQVLPIILGRLPVTLFLAVYATVLAAVVALPLGAWAALRRGRATDQAIRLGVLFSLATPNYWAAIVLLLVFSVQLRWFPVGGYGTTFGEHLWHLLLPALTIALSLCPILVRTLRHNILEVLGTDYVRTARAKGLRAVTVFARHILRNSLISTISILGINLGFLVGGAVVTETVYAIPGTGFLLIKSTFARDYPMVQGLTLMFASLVILVNLLTDLTYAVLDPRVRYD
ncbi:MAG TPA: ABC transporter permease [bacterium]|nr:ABC transporter permease [bacterium]